MPVRDVDMFTISSSKKIKIYGNRGASGIDGVVSTALGISAGAQNKCKTLLLIGDLSFFHDMNGLVASRYKFDLTIVATNKEYKLPYGNCIINSQNVLIKIEEKPKYNFLIFDVFL